MIKNQPSDVLTRRYVFPPDVKVVPAQELADHVRMRIGGGALDFALARPGHRSPSRMVDEDTLALLEVFRSPTPIGPAIVGFARARGLDPARVLEHAFPVLQSFTASLLLVPEDSPYAEGVVATYVSGQMVGGYEIRRLIQVLQDTEVYLARASDGGDVALKVARRGVASTVVEALAREAALLRQVGGPPAPILRHASLDSDQPFLVLEWLSGVSANTRAHELRTQREPGWRGKLHSIVTAMLQAYAALHARGVVHADVHSGNALVDEADRVRIIDYGLARHLEVGSPHNHAIRTGLTGNMEPEAARALRDGDLCPATFLGEQYMVASLAYTMVCGEHYAGAPATQTEMASRILDTIPIPFARHGFESWPAAEQVLGRALAKDPSERFDSVEDFRVAWAAASPQAVNLPVDVAREDGEYAKAFDRVVDTALDPTVGPESLFELSPRASVQYGAAGLAYFLYRASIVRDSAQLLAGADRWSRQALASIAAAEAFEAPEFNLTGDHIAPHSLYHGEVGVRVVQALIAHARGDARGVSTQCRAIADLLETTTRRAKSYAPEVVLGTSGALLGGAIVLQAVLSTGLTPVDGLEATLSNAVEAVWAVGPQSEAGHLGVAHGTAGALYAQLVARKVTCLPTPERLLSELDSLARHAEPRGRGVSWPGTLERQNANGRNEGRSTPDHAAGWCSGTAGHIHLWATAAEELGSGAHTALAERAGWHCWERTEREGHLCCGLAGRVFGLLRLYRHTGDPRWLRRAQFLNSDAEAWIGQRLQDDEPRKFGLFWGVLGPLLTWVELDSPETAIMPVFELEGWGRGASYLRSASNTRTAKAV